MFTDATVSAMSQQSPAFQMASNMLNRPEEINKSFGPPPAPVETKKAGPVGRQMQFTETPNSRQDINAARGTMFRESGVNVQTSFAPVNEAPRARPEMRGPALNPELDSILSGLKKAPAPRSETPQQPPRSEPPISMFTVEDVDDSMISISSLKDLQQSTTIPKGKGKRRNISDKNASTIRLDI